MMRYQVKLKIILKNITGKPQKQFLKNRYDSGPVHTYPDIFESATFSFRIKKFPCPHVTYSNRICLSTRSKNIRIHSRVTRLTHCAAILVHCWVRDWTKFTSSDLKISGFTVHTLSDSLRIYFFLLWRTDSKNIWIHCRIRRMRVDGSRIRKERIADSKISVYVWTGH